MTDESYVRVYRQLDDEVSPGDMEINKTERSDVSVKAWANTVKSRNQ